jgi:hypothetical protein
MLAIYLSLVEVIYIIASIFIKIVRDIWLRGRI